MRISDWSSDVCSSDLKNPVFAPAGQKMQFDAQPLESQVGTPQRSIFGWRQYFGMRNFAPGAAQPGSLRQPQDNLKVAQTARRFLAIRLQGIRRVLVTGVTMLQLCPLCLEERLRIHLSANGAGQGAQVIFAARSEEHTSELQS